MSQSNNHQTIQRQLSPEQREHKIQRLIWTCEASGIAVTREQAENAVEHALRKPLPYL